MINISLVGDQEVIARFGYLPDKMRAALYKKITALTLRLEAKVKSKLQGEVLHKRTGFLLSSVHSRVTDDATEIRGEVSAGADVPYAMIHEYGGDIHHPGGTPYIPNKAGMVTFVSKAHALADKLPVTKAHLIHIPQRSYLRSSMEDMSEEIISGIREAVQEGLE